MQEFQIFIINLDGSIWGNLFQHAGVPDLCHQFGWKYLGQPISTSHPSLSGSDQQSLVEQTLGIEHSGVSLESRGSVLIDKRFNNFESADSQGNNNQ